MHLRSKLLLTALVALVAASFAPGAFAAVKLRALHAIPDVGPVTVYVNGQPAVPSLGTLQETPYLEVPAGNYKVQVAPQGQPASAAVLSADVTLRDGKRYTAFGSGQRQRAPRHSGSRRTGCARSSARRRSASGTSSRRHPPSTSTSTAARRSSNVAFHSASGYLTLPAGKYDVRINVANSNTVVLSQEITLARGEAYTAVALGSAAQPAAGLASPWTPSATRPRVRSSARCTRSRTPRRSRCTPTGRLSRRRSGRWPRRPISRSTRAATRSRSR